ncbi:ATP-dependent DNA ligase LigC [Indibacter alkaliphilus LW1]|uniref:DNA ligase (ATP) n=1 Tax=Indibacter alkaliphilus (strain CCUG 57479 / KCTC 22604 / LW1) TaxID=1189612 RepID=S2E2D4_INDAL|nr:ATP-dependent DNA ligase [Indibacter alkaliphilus]EOZ98621.1 ATP-dependent DNA ligase LigC [Indibacter alkaliphilus LW1]
MQQFASLFSKLDQSNKTTDKLAALKDYFLSAPMQDRLWTLALFTHKRPKRQVNTRLLREWCCEISGIPDWLFEESYQTVGDLAETLALLLPENSEKQDNTLSFWIQYLTGLKDLDDLTKKEKILYAWSVLEKDERFIFTKIITGGFRVGVSQNLVTQAIADAFDMEKTEVAHRIMGDWSPDEINFDTLILSKNQLDDLSRPFPFFLAHPLEKELEELGTIADWQVEWKWDGIRGQLIYRKSEVFLWSRGEELVTEKFPEIQRMAEKLPQNIVLDGEIVAFENGSPLPFGLLQTRIGRKNLSKKILKEAPVSFIAYDMLEYEGKDIRNLPLQERRFLLEKTLSETSESNLLLSQSIHCENWNELKSLHKESREMMAEGFMLKQKNSPYEAGRKRGTWWKWKIEPLTIDGVMIYAQKGHGRRANLYSDYTLAVWNGESLVPFAKAYSGLTDSEIREVDKYVKQNTMERFGPVRTVKAGLVFEIAFEGIQKSSRHKSGIALRFPRIQRWRKDKPIEEANTLDDLKGLLEIYGV